MLDRSGKTGMRDGFIFTDSDQIDWKPSGVVDGVDFKDLGSADGRSMELYRFAPDTSYPDHFHDGPEFVFVLKGSAIQNGQHLHPGWASVGRTGSLDKGFRSGADGCMFLAVYSASRYIETPSDTGTTTA